MKILFVIDTLGSGGKERRLTELLKALTSRKEIAFELTVMSNDIHYNEIWDLGVKIHQIIRKSRRDLVYLQEIPCSDKTGKPGYSSLLG